MYLGIFSHLRCIPYYSCIDMNQVYFGIFDHIHHCLKRIHPHLAKKGEDIILRRFFSIRLLKFARACLGKVL